MRMVFLLLQLASLLLITRAWLDKMQQVEWPRVSSSSTGSGVIGKKARQDEGVRHTQGGIEDIVTIGMERNGGAVLPHVHTRNTIILISHILFAIIVSCSEQLMHGRA